MKRILLVLGIVVLSLAALLPGACSSTPAPTTTSTSQQPIEVVSVSGPVPPINPGGPPVQITLKNISSEPAVSLTASLGINRAGPSNTPYVFNFEVTSSNPLLPATSISSRLTLIGGSFASDVSYPLAIEGKLKSGTAFSYTVQVQIKAPPGQTDPWPGVPVYGNSNSPITTQINATFSIVLQPAPLFGWDWQNKDLSAFTLLETKTIAGSGNEPNPYGTNAFLFKAVETGTFQITLFVASKPPQQLATFNVVVNP